MKTKHNAFLKETSSLFFKGREDEPGLRIGEIAQPCSLAEIENYDCLIIGIPEYSGIIRNGGRITPPQFEGTMDDALTHLIENGAPVQVRKRLYGMTTGAFNWQVSQKLRIGDLGDILFTPGNVEEALDILKDILAEVYRSRAVPIVIGGGHHISISSIGALAEQNRDVDVGVMVLDAHCDFRSQNGSEIHSGIPFRFLSENYDNISGKAFVEYALRPERNARKYIEEMQKWGAHLVNLDETNDPHIEEILKINEQAGNEFLSIDIDAFDIQGASAAYPGGLDAKKGRMIARLWGGSSKIRGMDLVEVNPLIHPDSSELGAQLIWSFLTGLSNELVSVK